MSDLDLNYVGYQRENTGRAYAHADGVRRFSVNLVSNWNYEPNHPDAKPDGIGQGYVDLVDIEAKRLTRKQAKALATHLLRFARSGSVLKRGE